MSAILKERSAPPDAPKRERIAMLDALRGGAMLLVIAYHILFDLKFIYGVSIPRVITPGEPEIEFVHNCFLWVLFAVSGICSGFSHDPIKRGAFLYIAGWLITAFTSVLLPSELIVFGVLSCFGACMVISGFISPLTDRLSPRILFIVSVLLWLMFADFSGSGIIHLFFTSITLPMPENISYLYPIGLYGEDFFSVDYFPVIPYLFIFLAGRALYRPIKEHKFPHFFYCSGSAFLNFIGRHSLIIYAVHQPIILLILEIIR